MVCSRQMDKSFSDFGDVLLFLFVFLPAIGEPIQFNCIPSRYYCGNTISGIGRSSENQTLYRCDDDGVAFDFRQICDEGCRDSNDGDSYCPCDQDKRYCGHQLNARGWRSDWYEKDTIYQCTDGISAQVIQSCESDCISGVEDGSPRCDKYCIENLNYCGDKLKELGWPEEGYDNDTVYLCKPGGTNVSAMKKCNPGMCTGQQCDCDFGKYYCGHELYPQLGWDNAAADSLDVLYECVSNRSSLPTLNGLFACPRCIGRWNATSTCECSPGVSCQPECHPRTSTSWCECKIGATYCGYQLSQMGWRNYDERTMYECIGSGNNVKVIKSCTSNCSYLADINQVLCANECLPGIDYCGSKLHRMGFGREYIDDSVYKCVGDTAPLVDSGKTRELCTNRCVPGRFYCGRVIRYVLFNMDADVELRHLYKCRTDGVFEYISTCNGNCVDDNDDADAYCSTPWYFYFGGVTVCVLIFLLASLLVYFCLRHRRMKNKNSVRPDRIDATQLKCEQLLDRGEFGEVWRATYQKTSRGDPIDVALKLSNEKIDLDSKLACANCFLQEVVALNILVHPNIVKAFGVCTNYKDRSSGHTIPALVLEYMNGGNAIAYLRSNHSEQSIGRDLIRILTDVARAGVHLREMGIIHRDIAARNVLVRTDIRNHRVEVAKLTDFGLAKDIGKESSMYKSTNNAIVHCRYAAPEAIVGCFSSKSDVWSFGVLMWEGYAVLEETLMTSPDGKAAPSAGAGPTPYAHIRDASELFEKVRAGLKLERPRTAPDHVYNLMLKCWDQNPGLRPSFDELLAYFDSTHNASEPQLLKTPLVAYCPSEDSARRTRGAAEEDIEMVEGYTSTDVKNTVDKQGDGYCSAF